MPLKFKINGTKKHQKVRTASFSPRVQYDVANLKMIERILAPSKKLARPKQFHSVCKEREDGFELSIKAEKNKVKSDSIILELLPLIIKLFKKVFLSNKHNDSNGPTINVNVSPDGGAFNGGEQPPIIINVTVNITNNWTTTGDSSS